MVFTLDSLTITSGSNRATEQEAWNPLDSPVLEKKNPYMMPSRAGTLHVKGELAPSGLAIQNGNVFSKRSYADTIKGGSKQNGKVLSPPQPVRGGLSALFESDSRMGSRMGSRAGSDTEGPAGAIGEGSGKKKRNRNRKKKGGNLNDNQNTVLAYGLTTSEEYGKISGKAAVVPGRATADPTRLSPEMAKTHAIPTANVPLTFGKLPAYTYSSQPTSSASSDIDESEATTPFSGSPSPRAGTTPIRKSMLGELLENASAEPGDMITVTNEHGHQAMYEVALEHDFISGEVRSRPVTRSGSNESLRGGAVTPMGPTLRATTPQPHQKKKMCADDFEVLRCLGKGAYGTVLLVRHIATGKLYAQKQLKKASLITTKKLVEQTLTERQILEAVRHPFVVKLYYAFQDHKKLYLILEYAQGGELFMHLAAEKMFSEDTAAFYMASLVLALSHLHQNAGVVYRDLKPENCLLDHGGYLLLTDFGLSKVALPGDGEGGSGTGSRCTSWVGTVEYMAPEILLGKEYDEKVDWWSLGALGVDLMTGSPPFPGNNRAKIQEGIMKKKLALPYYLTNDAKDLLNKLLQKNPAKRWGVNDVARMKKHRFFRKINWGDLERRDVKDGPPIRPLVTDPELAENFSVDFTALACSPPVGRLKGRGSVGWAGMAAAGGEYGKAGEELFGGFSFVGDWGEDWDGRASADGDTDWDEEVGDEL